MIVFVLIKLMYCFYGIQGVSKQWSMELEKNRFSFLGNLIFS